MATKTTTGTHVNFVKVPTMANFEDITTKVAGTIYFIEDAQKIHLDGEMYGFNESDIADRFLELTGGEMSGSINMGNKSINSLSQLGFAHSAIVEESDGLTFYDSLTATPFLKLKKDKSIVFNSENITGIPEPVESSSPISRGYLETNVINKIGVEGGIASLNESGLIPSDQLPSYVDDIKDYNNEESFPNEGESDKIYLALDTGDLWRWAGNRYVRISDGSGVLVLGTTPSTAYRGDHGLAAYNHSKVASGNPHGVTKDEVKLGSVKNYGIASKTEAEDGKSDILYMTPQKTKNAIEKLSPILTWEVK